MSNEMTVYEISNPSDEMTIASRDVRVAQAAALLLGHGRCGLDDEHGANALPIFILGGADGWIEEHFPEQLDVFIDAHLAEIAACLESILYVSVRNRKSIVATLGANVSAESSRFNDSKRTSSTNYDLAAREIAQNLRARIVAANSS